MQFDEYAATYQDSVNRAAGFAADGLAGEKARLICDVLACHIGELKTLRVLDIGCGIGLITRELQASFAQLTGVDTSAHSIELAHQNVSEIQFIHYDGGRLPFADASFDAAFVVCVLHHVFPQDRDEFAREMMRVLRRGGAAIVIEHNPYNPVTRRIVSNCPFDADAVLLRPAETQALLTRFGAPVAGQRHICFSPFRGRLVENLERKISWLPIGAQYCTWGLKA